MLASLAGLLLAGSAGATLQPGVVVDPVRCGANQELSYALYLPQAFVADRGWPILYVFDARARGRFALELFRGDAERLGYIVASSNDTRANVDDGGRSFQAIQAMWDHTHATLPLQAGRAYASGLSGGARMATFFADAAGPTNVDGVFLASAGFGTPERSSKPVDYSVFMSAGRHDFNYYELRRTAQELATRKATAELEVFDGGHTWPPAETIARGLDWLELQAMRRGRRPPDAAFVKAWAQRARERAAALEANGQLVEASDAYASLVEDLTGLLDEPVATANSRRLQGRTDVRNERKRREQLDGADRAFLAQAEAALAALLPDANTGRWPTTAELARDLDVQRLRRDLERARDAYERDSLQRRIESLFSQASFFLPRRLTASREYARAAVSLGVAVLLKPDSGFARYDLGCALARSGRRREALAELDAAAGLHFGTQRQWSSDEDLGPLREDPVFKALLAKLPPGE